MQYCDAYQGCKAQFEVLKGLFFMLGCPKWSKVLYILNFPAILLFRWNFPPPVLCEQCCQQRLARHFDVFFVLFFGLILVVTCDVLSYVGNENHGAVDVISACFPEDWPLQRATTLPWTFQTLQREGKSPLECQVLNMRIGIYVWLEVRTWKIK